MLPESLTVALKEWAVVQRALLEGHQILLLRKGGIIEETGDFDLKSRCFLLYPTYEHEIERRGDIQPCFEKWLSEEEERKPPSAMINLEAIAEVTDVIRIEDREKMVRLSPTHVWSRQFIDGRFDWEPYKPIFALILRTYRLPEPQVRSILPKYGGCRSWIDLDEPVSTLGAIPAIGDEYFERRRALTLRVFSQ